MHVQSLFMNCFAVITPGFRVTRFWSNL